VGQYLVDGLWTLAERHEVIGDVRGSGFFLGLELVEDRERKTPATDLTKRVHADYALGIIDETLTECRS
jgi:4-aminobutyrate aminotransferase-like enzyme